MGSSVKPITNEAEYDAAMERVRLIWDPEPWSTESAELDALAEQISLYEEKRDPIPPSHPIDTIMFRMDQQGFSWSKLVIATAARLCADGIFWGHFTELETTRPTGLELLWVIRELAWTWQFTLEYASSRDDLARRTDVYKTMIEMSAEVWRSMHPESPTLVSAPAPIGATDGLKHDGSS